MKLTEPQKWALQAIADGYGATSSGLGQRMMERPGATDRTTPYKAQGYGRMGGAMIWRLERKGLVRQSFHADSYFKTVTLTKEGREALEGANK